MRTTPTRRLLPAVLAAVLALGACGGGDEDAGDEVASLRAGDDDHEDRDERSGGGRGGAGVDPEFQDALLDYAECMRDHGVDMPDPQFSEDGGVFISAGAVARTGGPGVGSTPSAAEIDELEAASEACDPIMEEARASMPAPDPEQVAEMQDQALAFARCMREHGIDFPDPTFDGDGGRISVSIGRAADGGGSALDPGDEDFQEAAEECGGEGGTFSVGRALPGGRVGGGGG